MEETRAAEVELALSRAGLAEVVDPTSRADTDAWTACDLASMVEGCFDHAIEPWTLGDAERERWLDRLGDSYEIPDPALDRAFLRYLWLLDDDGARVGTMALPSSALGRVDLPIWSLYVHPSRRGRGIASRALRAAHDAARAARLQGIRVDTHWVWQRSVRFYLERRMWVVSWKRALGFSWVHDLPRYTIAEDDAQIALVVEGAPWLAATRDGDRLRLEEDEALSQRYGWIYAHATLATVLATRGWPLIRSREHWERRAQSSDIGQAEGLALKIQVFEALARYWGWDVRTPRIPGLDYPDLGAI